VSNELQKILNKLADKIFRAIESTALAFDRSDRLLAYKVIDAIAGVSRIAG